MPPSSAAGWSRFRILLQVATFHGLVSSSSLAEDVFETRYQYYQEDDGRIRVDSDYSLWSVALSDTVVLDGTFLYSAISGASPTGLPGPFGGADVPVVEIEDERLAATIGLTTQIGKHSVKTGASYSHESDYRSVGVSISDTISLNAKNTELVLGFAFANDTVGANGSPLEETKKTYDWLVGINQILGPGTLLTVNAGLGYKDGFLSDPYKRSLIDDQVFLESRPDSKVDYLLFSQLTQDLGSWNASVDVSYRLGHNDHGSTSNTIIVALNKYLLDKRVVVRPSFRYYRQTAANYYGETFTGDPEYFSSDYRVSAEETFNLGMQMRFQVIPDRLALDVGYERYITRGTDGSTSQSAYPDAHSVSVGVHVQF
jgi:Protein of unknown function (DUF3570)